jgi:hypothetical protein
MVLDSNYMAVNSEVKVLVLLLYEKTQENKFRSSKVHDFIKGKTNLNCLRKHYPYHHFAYKSNQNTCVSGEQ